MTRTLIAAAMALLLAAGRAAAEPRVVSQGPTPGGWQYVLHSQAAGRDFRVQVSQPDLPFWRPRAAAIYVLDGDSRFRPVSEAARGLAREHRMTPAYVVAIGYPPGTDVQARRLNDLVHPQAAWNGRPIGGGGAAFEQFVVDELRPFIARRYRLDAGRSVLVGHSVGGLFAATVMARQTLAFGGYLVASPSLQFDPDLAARLTSVDGGGRRVFIAVGGEEGPMVALAERLAATLGGAGASFDVRQQTFAGESHMSVQGPMLAPGLTFLLPPKGR